jgi:hypothetical protein
MPPPEATSIPAQRRRQARQWEWAEQAKLAARLRKMLDPARVFWTAVDNQPWSKVAGIMRKRRGCRSGTPDLLILHKGKLIGLEMKSRIGRVSRAQKEVRLEMLRAGGMWWMARTARAALVALHRSGVGLRTRAGRRWNPPVLKPHEQPVADPEQPMVWHPAVLRQRRADRARQQARQRQRARIAAARSREADGAAAVQVTAQPHPARRPRTKD